MWACETTGKCYPTEVEALIWEVKNLEDVIRRIINLCKKTPSYNNFNDIITELRRSPAVYLINQKELKEKEEAIL